MFLILYNDFFYSLTAENHARMSGSKHVHTLSHSSDLRLSALMAIGLLMLISGTKSRPLKTCPK